MNLKLKLQLQVLFNPKLWFRLEKTNKEFDKWLWDKMEEGVSNIEAYYFCADTSRPAEYTVNYAGKEIWVSNAPYADIGIRDDYERIASRATALRFRNMYKYYLVKNMKE